MKTKMWMLVLLAAMIALPLTAQNVFAQKTNKKDDVSKKKSQTFTLKATKGTTERGGTDPNIKSDTAVNSPDAEFVGPKEKTGNTRGGGVCKVILDNRTNLIIKIFVDGTYRGTIAPYGDSVTYTGAGATRVYARADFDDGTYIYWGPNDYSCYSGQFINFVMTR